MSDELVINDYVGLGKVVCEWAENESKWPTSIGDFKNAVGDTADVPDRFKKLRIVQGDAETLVLRLPEKGPVVAAREDMEARTTGTAYPLPDIYNLKLSPIDMFYARIGDYCMSQCK